MQSNTKQALLLTWAILATVAAMVFAILALWLFAMRMRDTAQGQNRVFIQTPEPAPLPPEMVPPPQAPPSPNEPASPGFADLKETDVPGRYKFFEGGVELGTMTLNPDHTFINKDGTTFKQYRWDVSEDGLRLRWQRARSRFYLIEKPGVYLAPSPTGKDQRLEKID